MALDRPEIQFAVKECAKSMSNPTQADLLKLKRLGRYLKGHPITATIYRWQNNPEKVDIFTDSNWAGDKGTRKSTSGGAICMGDHLIKT